MSGRYSCLRQGQGKLHQLRQDRLRHPVPWPGSGSASGCLDSLEPFARSYGSSRCRGTSCLGQTIWDLTAPDAPGLDAHTITDFKELAACGLVGNFQLYQHQVEMLRKALSGSSAVVTAGTGSGKTESFLLPLFAYLIHESASWSTPGSKLPHQDDWWVDEDWYNQCVPLRGNTRRITKSLRVSQRAHETRDAAVRGLILYPMNALVEDQLSRLRRALDSAEAREWVQFATGRKQDLLWALQR